MDNGIDKLLQTIRSADEETARRYLVEHINMLAEHLVESSWAKAMNVMRFANKNRKKRLDEFILEENGYDGSISQLEFLKFFASVTSFLESNMDMQDDVKRFAEEIEDFMYLKIGNIRIDKRQLFSKELQ
jgi:hypothetical protein